MPRKAPSNVEEHRITFGNAERQLIKSTSNKMAFAEITKGVGAAVGGIGMAGLAAAGLIWVGFSLPDWIDNTSNKLVTFLEKKGYVRYQAPVYGEKLKECREEQEALFIEYASVANPNLDTFNLERKLAIDKRMAVLMKRDAVLVSIIADIANGDRKGYWLQHQIHGFDKHFEAIYDQEYQELYGGEFDQDDTSG